MNRQMLCKLAILYGWLNQCWNTDQHERILHMADSGFTVHEVAIAIWLCTDGWALEEVEQRMNNYIQNSGTSTKGGVRMGFTKETLWALRKEIVLNSLFIADYRNSLHIDPHMLCSFFDGFLEEVETQMEEEIPSYKDAQFFDYLPAYDTPDRLWDYYSSIKSELTTWEPEVMEAA